MSQLIDVFLSNSKCRSYSLFNSHPIDAILYLSFTIWKCSYVLHRSSQSKEDHLVFFECPNLSAWTRPTVLLGHQVFKHAFPLYSSTTSENYEIDGRQSKYFPAFRPELRPKSFDRRAAEIRKEFNRYSHNKLSITPSTSHKLSIHRHF